MPDSCCLEIDIRTLPGQNADKIIASLRGLCDEIHKEYTDFIADISVIRSVSAMETPADQPFLQAVCQAAGTRDTAAAGFTTDGPHFTQLSGAICILGPGDGSCATNRTNLSR